MSRWSALVLALTLGLALPGAAQAAVACPALVKAIDAALKESRSQITAAPDPPMDGDLAGLWDPVPFPFPTLEVYRQQWVCWQARKGRPVDAATRAAVIRASRLLLTKRNNEADAHDGENLFFWLEDGLILERVTGVVGPISIELKTRRLEPYPDLLDLEVSRRNFEGRLWRGSTGFYTLTQLMANLAALCLAHPQGYRAFVLSLGYEPALLDIKPSRRITEEGFPGQADFLDAEYDRILADCPT